MTRAARPALGGCPARDCSAGIGRQDRLPPAMAAEISEAWASAAQRCNYCGGVYTSDRVVHGFYDDPMGSQGWTPLKR